MTKKSIIIILITILLITAIFGLLIYSYKKNQQKSIQETEEKIKKQTEEFITAFGTYSYEKPNEYLPSLKSYCTDEFYQYLSERYYLPPAGLLRPEEKKNYSKTEVKEFNIDKISEDKAEVTVKVQTEKLDINIKPEIFTEISIFKLFLKKQEEDWKVDWMEIG